MKFPKFNLNKHKKNFIKFLLIFIPVIKWRENIKLKFYSDIKQHPFSASNGESMKPFAEWIKNYSTLAPENIFEIGANYAQDAEGLRFYLNIAPSNVWVFEAHPEIYNEIKKLYNKFNAFNMAVFNEEKLMTFNIVDVCKNRNTGGSSFYKSKDVQEYMKEITVNSIRMDNFMKKHSISKIDVLKLDVEKVNYEVLQGFGDRLKDVNSIHIEAEHKELWQGHKLYKDIAKILIENNFEQIYFQRCDIQSDSFWIQKKYINE